MKKRGEIEWDTFIPWVIGFIAVVILFIAYLAINGKLDNAGEFFRNLLRFGR